MHAIYVCMCTGGVRVFTRGYLMEEGGVTTCEESIIIKNNNVIRVLTDPASTVSADYSDVRVVLTELLVVGCLTVPGTLVSGLHCPPGIGTESLGDASLAIR